MQTGAVQTLIISQVGRKRKLMQTISKDPNARPQTKFNNHIAITRRVLMFMCTGMFMLMLVLELVLLVFATACHHSLHHNSFPKSGWNDTGCEDT